MAAQRPRQELPVVPGRQLGLFVLGQPIGLVLQVLRAHYHEFVSVQLGFSDASPFGMEIVVQLQDLGVQLLFEPHSQRLKTIDVWDLSKVTLNYNSKTINSAAVKPTFTHLYDTIGATQGAEDRGRKRYALSYPGLTLLFPVKGDLPDDFDLPQARVFPDGSDPVMSNLCVHRGRDMALAELPPVAETPVLSVVCPFYGQLVEIRSGRGVWFSQQNFEVRFGDSCQDVISSLGPPDDRFYKSEDTMRIHLAKHPAASRADYFFNYFKHGLDILFDAQTHVVKKFVMHSNVPGHFDFGIYNRCNFCIKLPRVSYDDADQPQTLQQGGSRGVWVESVVTQQPEPTTPVDVNSAEMQTIDLDDADENDADASLASIAEPSQSVFVVGPETKWDDVQHHLGSSCGKPVVFHREESANTVNPFGSTLFFSHNDLIFEVMQNQHIAGVTLFEHNWTDTDS